MTVQFEISTTIHASAQELYDAWLDSTRHSEMTGGEARVSAEVGGEFTAWDGYISGRNLELLPGKRIVQSWRTVEFNDADPDSSLVIELEPSGTATRIVLQHTNLPDHGGQYEQGWVDNYFEPMKSYFEGRR